MTFKEYCDGKTINDINDVVEIFIEYVDNVLYPNETTTADEFNKLPAYKGSVDDGEA